MLRHLPRKSSLAAPPATKQPDGQITSGLQKSCQAEESKRFRFIRNENQGMNLPVSPDKRGARDRHERAVGCGGREVRKASAHDAYGEVVWFWRPDAGVKS